MEKESLALHGASCRDSKMRSLKNNGITLSSIGPWTWFLSDFAIAFVFAAFAFSVTPYSLDMQQEAVNADHVGRIAFSFGTGLFVAIIAHIVGLHEPNQERTSFKLMGRCAYVSFLGLLILNIELILVHYLVVGRIITFSAVIGCTVGLFSVRALVVSLASRSRYVVGFVGSKKFTSMVPDLKDLGASVQFETVSLTLEDNESYNLLHWAADNQIQQVVVDPTDLRSPSQKDLLDLMNISLVVSNYSNFIEKLYQRIPSNHINAQWVIECQDEHALLYKSGVKRLLDIVLSCIALVILFPVGFIAAVCIKLTSPGPVIFKQTRVGQYGRSFTMFKLRSMVVEAEKDGAQWASLYDARVTKIGKFLRKSRIDEIPQLINVLTGDMSLVGPRPERPEFTPNLESRIPFFVQRVLVKPGITGWAQVNAGYASSEEDATEKLSFDLYYVKNLSLGMDLRVLLRTISSFAYGSR